MTQIEKYSEAELEHIMVFERLLADLSARFVNIPAEDVDRDIIDAQRQLCACLGVDISSVWQISAEDLGTLHLTHLHQPPGGPPPFDNFRSQDYFPWMHAQIFEARPVAISSTANTPPEAARDRETWLHFGVKSALALPLATGGGPVFGLLSFDTVHNEFDWPEALVTRCRVIAQVFANALARKRFDRALRDSEERYRSITLNLPGLIYQSYAQDDGTWGLSYVDACAGDMLGLSPEPLSTFFDRFAGLAQEHRGEWLISIRTAIATLTLWDQEFKFIKPNGEEIFLRGVSKPRRLGSEVVFYGVMRDVTERRRAEDELRRLKEQLQQENLYLRQQIKLCSGHESIIGESEPLVRAIALAEKVAPTDSVVLITGATGTGKELIAELIHDRSSRSKRAMVKVNCAALPAPLIESELFGREKGAYTGAMTRQSGRFEMADDSSLFLDEVAELPLDLQAKMLRVLQEGRFERLGSSQTTKVNVRIIAATNRNLQAMVNEGKFRADLFYRLSIFPIEVPPLSARGSDIPLLVWHFVQDFARKMGKGIDSIPRKTMEQLEGHSWPGNVRELRNLIERAVILCEGRVLHVELPPTNQPDAAAPVTLEEVERRHILQTLERTGWRVGGENGAAAQLGLERTTLHSMMKKLNIVRPAQ